MVKSAAFHMVNRGGEDGDSGGIRSFWTKPTLYIRWLNHQRRTTIHLSTSPSQEIGPEDLWEKQCRNTEIERFWFGGQWCQRWSQKSSSLSYHLWPLLAFPANTLFVSLPQFPLVTRSALLHIGWRSRSICLRDKEGATCLQPKWHGCTQRRSSEAMTPMTLEWLLSVVHLWTPWIESLIWVSRGSGEDKRQQQQLMGSDWCDVLLVLPSVYLFHIHRSIIQWRQSPESLMFLPFKTFFSIEFSDEIQMRYITLRVM